MNKKIRGKGIVGAIIMLLFMSMNIFCQELTEPGARIVEGLGEAVVIISDSEDDTKERRIVVPEDKSTERVISNLRLKESEFTDMHYPNKRIDFLNAKGKVIKTISLKAEYKVEKDVSPYSDEPAAEITYKMYKMGTYKSAVISKNGKYVGIVITTAAASSIDEQGNEYEYSDPVNTSKFVYYDVNGNELWEKRFPTTRGIHGIWISENGEIIVLYTDVTLELDPDPCEGEPRKIYYVLNKQGKELLVFPASPEYIDKYKDGWSDCLLSPNGRYLSFRFRGTGTDFFYDTKHRRLWDSGKAYIIYEQADNGIVKVIEESTDGPVSQINLKQYLGE
ncbi:MAG: hypothetical protein BWY26_00533 [Elusimicrobia bacterium ADurb.Bin231]|nr:MAG: hypothetical protein BWY26_00533 [Elusimicrobia bacterium ADurb.Bin231]